MCGIAGILGTHAQVTAPRLSTLAAFLTHRGPDDEGIEQHELLRTPNRVLGLIQRRLAIIDLSPAGHQPMRDDATGNWIVFNGEIYNFQELREELVTHGHTFRSQSDTEVICKAYAQWGVQCLPRFRGMFAFAIWDSQREHLFLAVDHFGIKPLYFAHRNRSLAFSSEMRALLAADIVPRALHPLAVESFLAYGTIQAPLTMIEGIEALLPGHALLYDCATDTVRITEYWKPHAAMPSADTPLRATLLDSVRHHLIADVPVALFLSGGIDSSALAILVHEIAGRALESFSVTFAESAFAEGQHAKRIGEQFCAHHHEIQLTDADLRQLLPRALDAMDQPTIDGMNVYVIANAVRDAGIKVVLSGQGGDEVFGGYSTFAQISRLHPFTHALRRIGALPSPHAAALMQWSDRIRGRSPIIESRIAQILASDGSPLSLYCILRQLFGAHARRLLLSGTSPPNLLQNGIPTAVAERLRDDAASLDIFNATSLFELRLYLANTLLRDGDVMSMAHGLEVRVPFLDRVLLEQVWGTPMREKMDPRLPKPLLLRQVIDQMPREIYDRQKMGFTFPWELWMRGILRPQIEEVFTSTDAALWTFLNRTTCQQLWRDFLAHRRGISWARVWALYVLLSWIQKTLVVHAPATSPPHSSS
ncbi:asparagine synthase (glutamine-hydrolyzing) [Candidatus Uhrbacteria bacterium]|nr:asparagine synthase (glutamine-hydrolyzing) [Candidatus Uhrbacteria bacterium]